MFSKPSGKRTCFVCNFSNYPTLSLVVGVWGVPRLFAERHSNSSCIKVFVYLFAINSWSAHANVVTGIVSDGLSTCGEVKTEDIK